MKKLAELLDNAKTSGVYALDAPPDPVELSTMASERGLGLFELDAEGVKAKEAFLKLAAAKLDFPDYFGENWDAFEDCLTDLSWQQAKGYIILVKSVDGFAATSPDDFATAVDIFNEAAEFWAGQRRVMLVLLQGNAGPEVSLEPVTA